MRHSKIVYYYCYSCSCFPIFGAASAEWWGNIRTRGCGFIPHSWLEAKWVEGEREREANCGGDDRRRVRLYQRRDFGAQN